MITGIFWIDAILSALIGLSFGAIGGLLAIGELKNVLRKLLRKA